MKNNPLQKLFIIKDLETLRVIADPTRTQILEILVKEPQTVKQVAEKLGITQGKLYYHFNLLEKHKLIMVVETRQKANMIEKKYRAKAGEVEVDPSLLNFTTEQGKESINALLTSVFNSTRDDIERSLKAREHHLQQGAKPQHRNALVKRIVSRISPTQADEFFERVCKLIKEFDESDYDQLSDTKDENVPYGLTVAYYPNYFYVNGKDVTE